MKMNSSRRRLRIDSSSSDDSRSRSRSPIVHSTSPDLSSESEDLQLVSEKNDSCEIISDSEDSDPSTTANEPNTDLESNNENDEDSSSSSHAPKGNISFVSTSSDSETESPHPYVWPKNQDIDDSDHDHESCDSMSQSSGSIHSQPFNYPDSDPDSCNGQWYNCGCKHCTNYKNSFIWDYLRTHRGSKRADVIREIVKIEKRDTARKNICHKCRKPGFARTDGGFLKCESCYEEFKQEEKNKADEEKEKEKEAARKSLLEKDQQRAEYRATYLDPLPYEKVDLMTYGIKIASDRMGWNKFPFGAKDINKGNIIKNLQVDSAFWKNKKRNYLVRNFSDELKIVKVNKNEDSSESDEMSNSSSDDDSDSESKYKKDDGAQWSCCKNRIDAFNFKLYLKL